MADAWHVPTDHDHTCKVTGDDGKVCGVRAVARVTFPVYLGSQRVAVTTDFCGAHSEAVSNRVAAGLSMNGPVPPAVQSAQPSKPTEENAP